MNEESSTASTKIRLVRATSAGALAAVLGLGLAGTFYSSTAFAAETAGGTASRALDMETHYSALGLVDSDYLQYAKLSFQGVNDDGTLGLTLAKWAGPKSPGSHWDTDTQNEWAGKIILSFSNRDFFSQIETIQFKNGSYMQKYHDGAMWTLAIVDAGLGMGSVGVATNDTVTIKLKDGATLESLGLADEKLGYEMVFINKEGLLASDAVSTGYIQQNNDAIKNEKDDNGGFLSGVMTNTIVMDTDEMRINSVHTWKPDQNYLQSDYGWVVYIREQVPAELLPFIDLDGTQIYNSDIRGNYVDNKRTKWSVNLTKDGKVDTSTDPELSIAQYGENIKLSDLNRVRDNTNDIFWGTLGRFRNYTISYKLKEGISLQDLAKAANDLAEKSDGQLTFESSLAADYQDKFLAGGLIGKADDGEAPKQLTGSYANSYLQANDKDKDSIFDFVEFELGYNYDNVDSDGDGVPDPQELWTDKTDGADAGQYKVSGPTTKTTSISPTLVNTITGTMPKTVHKNPADEAQTLHASSEAAGNAVVKLVQAEEDGTPTPDGEIYATYLIPLSDLESGSFTLSIPANTIPTTAKKAVLVGTDPKGVNTSVGTVISIETQAEHYNPVGRNATANPGDAAPNPQSLITNAASLPKGTTYAWKQAPNLANEGDVAATIIVTYPDNSTDRVPVTIDVTANVTQAQTYSASGGSVEKDYGQTATLQELAATVTYDPKLAEGVKPTVALADKASIPTGGKNNKVPLVVTYPDGSKDSTEVTLTYGDASDAFTPGPQAIEVSLNKVPAAADGIANKDGLPKGTAYAWKGGTAPDTSAAGDKAGTVVVTYPDGTADEVAVTVKVKSQAAAAEPRGKDLKVPTNGPLPEAAGAISNLDELPAGTQVAWKEPRPDTTTPGTKDATVTVTYPGGASKEVAVKVKVGTDAEAANPEGQQVTAKTGAPAPAAEAAIKNKDDLPKGTKIEWVKEPVTTTPGTTTASVKVTYPDNSSDTVKVPVKVGTDAEANTPVTQVVNVQQGAAAPAAADGIANKDGLPKGTAYAWKGGTAPDTSAAGDKAGTVVVTYPDGTADEVAVTVKVKSQAAAAEPRGKDLKVPTNGPLPEASGAISNLDELPAGTQVAWKEPRPDTTTPGTKDATVTVTYPGGASKEVAVKVKVGTDAEANTPVTQVVKAQKGTAAPAAQTAIKNKDDLPAGTKIEWVEEPNTDKVGERPAFVKVTYPDGTSDVVKATVKVGTDADAATPEAKDDVKVPTGGNLPAAKDAIENLDELPKGTTAKWAEPAVDTTTPGNQTGKVEVTYPDGSKETVDVPVKVGTDAEVHEPKYGAVSTPMGTAPSAAAAVKNGAQLPVGTTYTWKTKPDTANPGTTKATVVVTYPDGSADEGEVEITVTDTRPDSLKYEAAGGELTKGYGQTATLAELKAKVTVTPQAGAAAVRSIELPAGATIPTKGKDLSVSLVVNYADGTQDVVTVKLTYGDAADAFTPQPAPITVDLGTAPAASDGIANKNDLPTGTSYGWKNGAPDTSQPGAAGGTVVVTYPDGTTAEVPVTVTINDTRNEAEKHRVTGDALEVAYGTAVTEADVIAKVTVSPKPAEGTVTSIALADGVTIPTNGKGLKVPVKVTFSDGSSTTAEVTLTYGDANAANTPVAQPIEALVNSTPAASDAIANLADLPGGTTVAWKDAAPNTGKAGTVNATAVVTYPDGTTDEVPVTITVKTAADAYNPTAKDDVKVPTGGELPPAGDVIEGELPDGTTVVWKEPKPDTTKPGDQTGKVEVTYPDGSKETVDVPVKVGTDAELYDPTAKDGVKVDTGAEVPAATDVIEGELPGGAKVEWTKEPDTSKPGNQTGIVKVTYPDGSSDVVEVPVKVGTDAEATDPKGQDVTVGEDGKLPDPTHAIANPGGLPDGTKLQWKDPKPDPTKPGEQTGTIVVTYPDGSTEELTVTVKVPEKADGNGKDAGKKGKGGKRGRGILPKTGDASTLAAGSLMGGGILASAFGSVLAAWKRRRRSE